MTKPKLTKEEILHLAKLANLQLSEEEIEKYRNQFIETLDYVKNLDELDTSGTIPTSSTANLKNIFFEDGAEPDRTFSSDEATANAVQKKDSLFVVSRIL